jgi:hypothetical protein
MGFVGLPGDEKVVLFYLLMKVGKETRTPNQRVHFSISNGYTDINKLTKRQE